MISKNADLISPFKRKVAQERRLEAAATAPGRKRFTVLPRRRFMSAAADPVSTDFTT
jgi:hypothetical protein